MFSSLTSLTNGSNTDMGERLLNTAASQSIRHLFSQSEAVEVTVRCQPSSKILQGSIDSFKMSGRGLVIRKQFQVEEMSFETDAVAIDFGSVLKGQIRLKQPTQAIAQVMLSEAGINHAFRAELVKKRLQNVSTPELDAISGDQPVTFSDVEVQLLPRNQIRIFAKAELPSHGIVPVSALATLTVERRRRIAFNEGQFQPDAVPNELQEISQVLTEAFIQSLNGMVDLDRFDLDGVNMRINRLETQGDKLIFSGYAQIEHFPRT